MICQLLFSASFATHLHLHMHWDLFDFCFKSSAKSCIRINIILVELPRFFGTSEYIYLSNSFILIILDSRDINKFIDMMAIAAGESDYDIMRVTYLQDTCHAFSPFIDLRRESGFNEFNNACKETNNQWQADREIGIKLVSD